MKVKSQGFTLIELSIVLVIIGLLIGGVLKGQALIDNAKVKNIANDFRAIQTQIYAYQDRFKALPGDDSAAVDHLGAGATNGDGDGVIEGAYNAASGESFHIWRHLRMAQLATGPADTAATAYLPTNADGGRVGVQAGSLPSITGLIGTYVICSTRVAGKFARQLDIMLDDGNTATGTVMATAGSVDGATAQAAATSTSASQTITDTGTYTVCMAF